jgi:hypothetical protein
VTLRGTRAEGAFGELNIPITQVRKNLCMALKKAETHCLNQTKSGAEKFPLERLRRRIASAMALDVIFSKRIVVVQNNKWPNSRLKSETSDIAPVWRTAPNGAFYKANKLCNLLHTIAASGWKANVVHDLTRLATCVWRMTKRSFDGLIHRILSRIFRACDALRSSPDPVQRIGTLSTNPVCPAYSVYRFPDRREGLKTLYGVKHLPKTLGLHVLMRKVLRLSMRSIQVVCATRD